MNRRMNILIVLILLLFIVIFTRIDGVGNQISKNEVTVSDSGNYVKFNEGLKENEKLYTLTIEYIGLIDNSSFEGTYNDNFIVFRGNNIAQKIEKLGVDTGDFIYIIYTIDKNQSKIVESLYKLKIDTGKYQGISNNNIEIKISGVPDVLPSENLFVEDQVIDQIKKIGIEINENIKFIYYINEVGIKCIIRIVRINN